MNPMRESDVYLTVYPGRYSWELRVAKATNKRPRATPEGSIVVKLHLKVPREAFLPLTPNVEVEVPIDMVQRAAEVEPMDASTGGAS